MGNDILYDTVLRIILKTHLSNISIEPRVVVSFFSLSFFVLNSFLNPLIYAIRMRQFCVAFNELCRTANVSLVQKTKITSNKLITTWSSLLYCVAIVQKNLLVKMIVLAIFHKEFTVCSSKEHQSKKQIISLKIIY